MAQERKAAKPLADELQKTKKLWERLRRKSHVPKEERDKLVEELFAIIAGRVQDFVLKHDAVRVIQTAIKYANAERRRAIATELQGTYVRLAESRYAKFLIGKLIVHGESEIRDMVVPEFYGKVRRMINHPEASWILDDIYRQVATKTQKAMLLREWYGPDYVLLEGKDGDVTAELSVILKDEPAKREPTLKYLLGMCNQLIQKQMTGFTMLHDAMLQYYLNISPGSEQATEFMEMVKGDETGDLSKNMAFTKSGARLLCLLLAYGSAKDRKHIIRALKDSTMLMCSDQHAHVVILAAYDLIDDTVLTSKTIFPELVGREDEKIAQNLLGHVNNLNARTTIRYLFEGMSKALFPASHSTDIDILNEIHKIRETTSKKDAQIRQRELAAAIAPLLLRAIARIPAEFVSTPFGCQFLAEVLFSAPGDKTEALKAVAGTAAGDPTAAPEKDEIGLDKPPHIAQTAHGARMLKTLIAGGKYDKAAGKVVQVDPPLKFADMLYPVIKDHIVKWATGPSSFVVLSILEAGDFSDNDELRKTLRKHRKELEAAATATTVPNGAAHDGKGKKADGREKQAGNTGARLILEKL